MKLFELLKKADHRTDKRKTGDIGEQLAAQYLEKNGYIILDRNWKCKKDEIDIIALKNEYVIFVEVKTTASNKAEDFKLPSQAVDKNKRICLTRAARQYVAQRKSATRKQLYQELYRFDIIEVYLNRDTPEINHIQDAFFAEKGNKKSWQI